MFDSFAFRRGRGGLRRWSRRGWAVALLIAVAGLLIHPVLHQQSDAQCEVCLVGEGGAPLPVADKADFSPPTAFFLLAVAHPTLSLATPGCWRRPPGRAPPVADFS